MVEQRRAAGALLAGTALAVAACGGDEPAPEAPRAKPTAVPPAQLPRLDAPAVAARSSVPPEVVADRVRRRADARVEKASRDASRRARSRAARAVARSRRALAESVALELARAAGFPRASASAGEGGRRVVVRLAAGDCRDEASGLSRRVRGALSFVRSVRVAGGVASCAPVVVGEGDGRLLFSRSGRGAWTGRVDVPARRWTVDYAARAEFFQLVVTRGSELLRPPVLEHDSPAGQRVFRGSGAVVFRVAADGDWVLRVRRAG